MLESQLCHVLLLQAEMTICILAFNPTENAGDSIRYAMNKQSVP